MESERSTVTGPGEGQGKKSSRCNLQSLKSLTEASNSRWHTLQTSSTVSWNPCCSRPQADLTVTGLLLGLTGRRGSLPTC